MKSKIPDPLLQIIDGVALHDFAIQAAQKLGARHVIAAIFKRDAKGELTLIRLADTVAWAFDPEAERLNPRLQHLLIEMTAAGKPYLSSVVKSSEYDEEYQQAWARYRKATGCTTFLTVPVVDSGVARGFACFFAEHEFAPSAVRALSDLTHRIYARMLALALIKPQSNPLTPRQREALRLCADGKSDNEIGGLMQIAGATAHEHIEQAKRRLNVHTRIQAVVIAVRNGWI